MTAAQWLQRGLRREARGVICRRVYLKALRRAFGAAARAPNLAGERITDPDYLSGVIKAVPTKTASLPISKKTRSRSSSFPLQMVLVSRGAPAPGAITEICLTSYPTENLEWTLATFIKAWRPISMAAANFGAPGKRRSKS